MKPPSDLILASASAYLRVLACKDYQSRQAAEREYEHIERQIAAITKIVQPTGHVPLGGMSAQDLLR